MEAAAEQYKGDLLSLRHEQQPNHCSCGTSSSLAAVTSAVVGVVGALGVILRLGCFTSKVSFRRTSTPTHPVLRTW